MLEFFSTDFEQSVLSSSISDVMLENGETHNAATQTQEGTAAEETVGWMALQSHHGTLGEMVSVCMCVLCLHILLYDLLCYVCVAHVCVCFILCWDVRLLFCV